jgi:septal ring factor EnvC (AmiA/AmiB activator)
MNISPTNVERIVKLVDELKHARADLGDLRTEHNAARADLEDAKIDLRNSRALNRTLRASLTRLDAIEQDRRRAWAQQILRHADDLDWDAAQIAAYVAGIASEVPDA